MHDEAAVVKQRPRAVGRALDVERLRATAHAALLFDLVDDGFDLAVVRRRADDEVFGDADKVADLLHHDVGGLLLVCSLRGDDGALARTEQVRLLTAVHVDALIDVRLVVHCFAHLLPFVCCWARRFLSQAT